jgi:hypothetical protein
MKIYRANDNVYCSNTYIKIYMHSRCSNILHIKGTGSRNDNYVEETEI